jgi:hypothetical protein
MPQIYQPMFDPLKFFISSIYGSKDTSNSIYLIIDFPTLKKS